MLGLFPLTIPFTLKLVSLSVFLPYKTKFDMAVTSYTCNLRKVVGKGIKFPTKSLNESR